MSLHINAEKGSIAPIVLLPGDPLRAKYIAENWLKDPKLVSTTRNMFYFTGEYKKESALLLEVAEWAVRPSESNSVPTLYRIPGRNDYPYRNGRFLPPESKTYELVNAEFA